MLITMRHEMKNRYRVFRRGWGTFYCEDLVTKKQESLKTRNKGEAYRLVAAKNETEGPVSFRPILQGFDGEHESDDLLDLRPARPVQTVSISRVVILAVVRDQLVTVRRRIRVPEINRQGVFDQHEIPIVNDADLSPSLLLVFVLKIPQPVMQHPRFLAVQLRTAFVRPRQNCFRF